MTARESVSNVDLQSMTDAQVLGMLESIECPRARRNVRRLWAIVRETNRRTNPDVSMTAKDHRQYWGAVDAGLVL